MSIDEPAPGSGSRGDLPPGMRRFIEARGRERTYLSLLPWRSFRRVVFLIFALLAVVALKKSAGGFFNRVLESVAPAPAAAPAPARPAAPPTTVHLQPGPSAK